MTIILPIIAGFLHGVHEGLAMSLRAYPDWVQIPYHLLPIVTYGILIWIGARLYQEWDSHTLDLANIRLYHKSKSMELSIKAWVYYVMGITACIPCAWESSEIAQIIVRWHDYAPLFPYENVIGLHVVTGWVVYLLHAGRIALGVILTFAGRLK